MSNHISIKFLDIFKYKQLPIKNPIRAILEFKTALSINFKSS